MSLRPLTFLLLFAAPLALGGCLEGYEMIRTDTMFPYGNQRTAGTGIAYVQEHMMPERDLNLAPESDATRKIMKAPAAPSADAPKAGSSDQEDQKALENLNGDMDELFEKAQQK